MTQGTVGSGAMMYFRYITQDEGVSGDLSQIRDSSSNLRDLCGRQAQNEALISLQATRDSHK